MIYGIELLTFLFVGLIIDEKFVKYFLFVSAILIALPSFWVIPAPGIYFDTIRFNDLLDMARQEFYSSGIFASLGWDLWNLTDYINQPLVICYIWIFSLFPNDGFFRLFTIIFFLLILFKLAYDIKSRFSLTSKSLILSITFLLMVFNIFFEIEGIRNFLAFIIFAYSAYLDFFTSSKFKPIIGYLFASFFHPFALVFFIIRIVMLFNNKFIIWIYYLLALTWIHWASPIITFSESHSSTWPFSLLSDKAQTFIAGQNNFQEFAGAKEIIFTSLILILLIINYLFFYRGIKKLIPQNYNYFYKLTIFFCVGSFESTQLYLRSIIFILFLSLPYLMNLFDHDGKDSLGSKVCNLPQVGNIIFALSMFIFWYYYTYTYVLFSL